MKSPPCLVFGALLLDLHLACSSCLPEAEECLKSEFGGLLQVGLQVRSHPGHHAYYRQELTNFGDMQYTGQITLGDQSFQAVMDTGSYEVLVFSTQCDTCGRAGRYSSQTSRTYSAGKLTKKTTYGSGSTVSIDGADDLSVGPLTVIGQSFWEATSANMPVLSSAYFQAIVGLQPPGEPQIQAAAMIKEARGTLRQSDLAESKRQEARQLLRAAELTMAKNDSVLQNLGVRFFSTCFQWESGAPAFIIWNDRAPQEQEVPFRSIEVVSRTQWSVRLTDAHFQGPEGKIWLGCGAGCDAVLDTGTSLISVPTDVYNTALSELSKLDASCLNLGSMPDLSITLGGRDYSLPPQSYVGVVMGALPRGSESWFPRHGHGGACELLLMDSGTFRGDIGPVWIIGMPFFRYYYTTFDLGSEPLRPASRRVWTAPASRDCTPAHEEEHAKKLLFAKSQPHWRINASLVRVPEALKARLQKSVKEEVQPHVPADLPSVWQRTGSVH